MSLARRRQEARAGWLFITPALAHLLVFALLPILYAAYLSLFKWQLAKETAKFVGLGNYKMAFSEGPFWNAMGNSFRYAALSVPLGMAVALAVAILVNQKLRGVTVFRTLYYLPSITSGVAIAMLWTYVYLPKNGLIDATLAMVGMDSSTDFLNNPKLAMLALVVMSVFTGLGPRMILFLSGLLNIPASLYEAADLDGAGKWRVFRSITLPLLIPTTLFVLVTSTIGAMQVFTPVYMMTHGGPEDTTDVVGFHIYTEAWMNFNTGLAAAKSFVLLAVIVAISVVQFRLSRSQMRGYQAG